MVPGYDLPRTTVLKETAKALLVHTHGIGNWWVPKSQITRDSEVRHEDDYGELCVTEWFAKQKGWL